MKFKRNDVMYLYLLLQNLPNVFNSLTILYDKLLLYYFDINKSKFRDIAEACIALRMTTEPTKEYLQFNLFKDELTSKFFYKTPDGELVFDETRREEFNTEYQKLLNTHGKYVIEHDTNATKVGNFLQEEVDVDIEYIPFALLPNMLPKDYYEDLKILCNEFPSKKINSGKV